MKLIEFLPHLLFACAVGYLLFGFLRERPRRKNPAVNDCRDGCSSCPAMQKKTGCH